MTDEERFWPKVSRSDGCWEWTGSCFIPQGYGRFWMGGTKYVRAHRFAYELLVGPIPDGLVLDHLCRNRKCVRPDHLEPVTQGENVLRGVGLPAVNVAKTHCIHGHEFTEANTYRCGNARNCRACHRIREIARYRRRKESA